MALNLDSIVNSAKAGKAIPTAHRGRTATPIPESITKLVRDSYNLPKGEGTSVKVPNGELTKEGRDPNVTEFVGMLRRAATAESLGLSLRIMDRGAKTTEVLFRAKDKSKVTRRTKEQKRADDLIAAWVEAGTEEYDGAEDDAVALAAWERYVELPEDDAAGDDAA